MNDRIQLILKTKNISASKFADEIGVQRSSISHILSGRNNPSLDFIQKILKRFADINSDWILTGKGSMYIQPDLFSNIEEHKTDKNKEGDEILNSDEDIPNENSSNYVNNEPLESSAAYIEDAQLPLKQKNTIKKEAQTLSKKKEEIISQGIVMKPVKKKIERIITSGSNS